jgi:hypothetical protein
MGKRSTVVPDDRANEKVVVAYLHPGTVHGAFMESLLNLLVYDMAFHKRIVDGGGRLSTQASANLAGPRNTVVKQFLAFGEADWLWFVDSDMVFEPDTLERLLQYADPDKAPIVGGLCFGFDEGRVVPTLYDLVGEDDGIGVVRYNMWPPDAMFQVAATGTGCILIHKSVLEKVRDFMPESRPGQVGFNQAYPWFQEMEHEGQPVGEDITFCWRAGIAGVPVYVNTAVHIGHVKQQLLSIDAYFAQRRAEEAAAA